MKPIYEAFCKGMKEDTSPPYPLTVKRSFQFVRYLAERCGFAIGSIDTVFVASVKRLHKIETGASVPLVVQNALRAGINLVRRTCPHLLYVQNRQPCCINDVAHIIQSTPDGYLQKNEEASCWLLSVSTGARLGTMTNILLQDIIAVRKSSNLGPDGAPLTVVQFLYRVLKNEPNANHRVSVEGSLTIPSNTDPVYHLEQHLQKAFNLSLFDYYQWKNSNLTPQFIPSVKVWHWNDGTMYSTFKSAAEKAGYPHDLFCFHSLRAGFICSAIINCGSNGEARAAALETTAFVAKWVPNSKAQLGYCNNVLSAVIIGNRLTGGAQQGSPSTIGATEPALTTPQAFHNLASPPIPIYNKNTNYQTLRDTLIKAILTDSDRFISSNYNKHQLKCIKDRCFSKAFHTYAKANPHLLEKAIERNQTHKSYNSKCPNLNLAVAAETVVREHFTVLLHDDYATNIDLLLGKLLPLILFYRDDDPWKPNRARISSNKKVYTSVIPRVNEPGQKRVKTLHWTDEELSALMNGYKIHGNDWEKYAVSIPRRTSREVSQKWRHLQIKAKRDLNRHNKRPTEESIAADIERRENKRKRTAYKKK